jgi:Protein of unknown function (DUF3179)
VECKRSGRIFSIAFVACFIVALAAVAYPLYVIRPFRPQDVRELAAALVVLRIRPWIEIVSLVACLIALAWYWSQQSRILSRTLAVLGALLVGGVAWLSRINVYELMFHPNDHPSFSAASGSKLEGDEKVIAVNIGGAARAYPIRSMSYHHIVNDTVGGVPIVATY